MNTSIHLRSSSQALYFQLGMRADDDGFVASPKKIAKISNCGEDDLRILASKGYIIPFDSGVVVVTHWGVNNNKIKGDRYKQTIYVKEKDMLRQDRGVYSRIDSAMFPSWNQYWNPENTESYWEKAIDGSRRFYEKYKTPFAKGLAEAFMAELERRSKKANGDKF